MVQGGVERHNAFEVDWDGNVWAQGSLEGTALILKSSTAGSEKAVCGQSQ